jgi:hypothetical protein
MWTAEMTCLAAVDLLAMAELIIGNSDFANPPSPARPSC